MQLDPSKRPAILPPSLKRPLPPSRASSSSALASSDLDARRPGKVPKLGRPSSPKASSSPTMPPPHARRGGGGPGPSHLSRVQSAPSPRGQGRRNKPSATAAARKPQAATIPDPIHDHDYIVKTYRTKSVKPVWEDNPKSPLSNYCTQYMGQVPAYESVQGIGSNGRVLWRTTLHLRGDNEITAYGDHANRKDSERLAALCALYQMGALGLFDQPTKAAAPEASPIQVTLSEGTVVDFEKARQFMDYYCRRFKFGKPEIAYTMQNKGGQSWQADMTVNGRRIGFGKGPNKKIVMMSCYVDVTQYLEQCDPDIWKQFVQDAKTGKDLGLAPRVLFQIDDALQDQVEDLCSNIKKSQLYRNRPRSESSGSRESVQPTVPDAPRLLYRRPVPYEFLTNKSDELRQRRQAYLEDPEMAKMRQQRANLPVYTKADELLSHIRENEVTICMAATGSGKTTQLPQLILDEWIDKGEGAKCNIVCTQPRRIAAISVAGRVAKERGQAVGRGSSIGYQVRFEHNLPDEHGSITFCTTGIFLKRMQSALLGGESVGRSLDDVTHVVVDEVHERDVDTDLLLVVLKRLLADRKARKKPIKIVLMSATIDPTLFQQYFPDEKGQPASVIDIPGRAFPVEKKFLDEFVPVLADPSSNWVFQEEPVQKFLTAQMGMDAPVPMRRSNSIRPQNDDAVPSKDDELEMPIPLVALTIAHVMRKSDDGHVLVFLPGWDDIIALQKCLTIERRSLLGMNFTDQSRYSIHLLHSTIPIAEQQAIFEPPPQGVRRIILATNIAETSVTIPDVVCVVDTARVKEQRYDPDRHVSALVSAWVGSSNLNQRAGRAGRHRPGEYYGILTRRFADHLHPYQTVEMKRVDLSNVVMHVKALNFPGMSVEEVLAATIEPPAPERVKAAIKALQTVGALDHANNLTSLGRVLLQLPVDVQMGRLVLFGSFFSCLDQALTLAAILTNRDPFVSPMHLKVEANAKKNSFTPEDFRSDALATLNAFNAWWEMQKQGHYVSANKFCVDNYLAKPTLLMIQKIKEHLLQSLYTAGVIEVSAGGAVGSSSAPRRGEVPPELNVNHKSTPLLAALITIGTQPKYALRTGEKTYRTATDKAVFIHPSSVNHRKRELQEHHDQNTVITEKQIIAYAEKRQNISTGSANAQKFLVTTSRLDPLTYLLFGAHNIEVTARGLECDEWLPIIGRQDALDDVERLKVLMEACMLRVFEGIIAAKQQTRRRPLTRRADDREDESGDEEDAPRDRSLTGTEIQELDLMTRDIVSILNDYSRYRIAMQSQHNSRPGTPMDSPAFINARLPSFGGSRSGYSTPYNIGSAYNSRPGTPSRLSGRRGF